MENLHILTDIVVAAVVIISIIFAYYRGLSRELFALIAWIGATVFTIYYFKEADELARKYISVDIIADIAAGSILFLGALIVISLVTHFIAYHIQNSAFGPIDRSLGIVFGALRGEFIVCLAYFALLWAVPGKNYPTWLTKAKSYPYVEKTTYGLLELTQPYVKGSEFGEVVDESLKTRGSAGAAPVVTTRSEEDIETPPEGYATDARQELDKLIEETE